MPKAPKRKAGNFYMWAVENGMEALGRYGMHSGQLGEYGFATFGGERERRRTSPPDHWSKILMEEMDENNPLEAYNKFIKLQSSKREALKKKVDEATLRALKPSAPIYIQKDIDIIRNFVDNMSSYIFDVIYNNLDDIQNTFRKCKASKYADFAEFFCWLYHLTFTEAMDYLLKKQKLRQPLHGYEYWIWKINQIL